MRARASQLNAVGQRRIANRQMHQLERFDLHINAVFVMLREPREARLAASRAGSATGASGSSNKSTSPPRVLSRTRFTGKIISFGPAPTLVFGGTGTVGAVATTGLPVSFSTGPGHLNKLPESALIIRLITQRNIDRIRPGGLWPACAIGSPVRSCARQSIRT